LIDALAVDTWRRTRMLGRKLTPGEVAILETFVIPRYLSHFGEVVLDMMLTGDFARVAHLGCRTGYPDRQLVEMVDTCSVVGVDSSLAAVELARNKAATLNEVGVEYIVATGFPTALESGTFSHAMALHPTPISEERQMLFEEMERVLYAGGQALVAVPLRGSFQELGDLLREYALKYDDSDLGKAMDQAALDLPTIETLTEELEVVGFSDVDFELRQVTLSFDSGRAFVDDPVTRLMVLPELQEIIGDLDVAATTQYVADAIDKYWAKRTLDVMVKIGAVSARKA
jgi:ubiquinone/menaquinone biosynthesis C-methylase UbiE